MRIVSGGQTGVDRAALDTAVSLGIDYGGWCPKGGWAEDQPVPPGVRALYPGLTEAPSRNPAQRTRWNVRDSDRTLVLFDESGLTRSRGTLLTLALAKGSGKPHLTADIDVDGALDEVTGWLAMAGEDVTLNIAGPRESTAPGIYRKSRAFLDALLKSLARQ